MHKIMPSKEMNDIYQNILTVMTQWEIFAFSKYSTMNPVTFFL